MKKILLSCFTFLSLLISGCSCESGYAFTNNHDFSTVGNDEHGRKGGGETPDTGIIPEGGGDHTEDDGFIDANQPGTYRLNISFQVMLVGDQIQLVVYRNDEPYKGKVTWECDEPDVVYVTEEGLMIARGRGTGNVAATINNKYVLICRAVVGSL